MAILHGLDPVVFANREGLELMWSLAAIQKAENLYIERQKAMITAIGVAVGNEVARRIAEMFR